MSKSMLFFLMLFLSGQVYAVSGRFSEPHQIGIVLKNGQPCFYMHSGIAINSISIDSHHHFYSKNGENVYLGGIRLDENNLGSSENSCVLIENLSFGLDIPYMIHLMDKKRPSTAYSHSEKFCIRKKMVGFTLLRLKIVRVVNPWFVPTGK